MNTSRRPSIPVKPDAYIEHKKKIIDMVTRLYVYLIRWDRQITEQEINILYSLLVDLFSDLDISWEVYIREMINSNIDLDTVLLYLNLNLNIYDKARLLLSLLVMVESSAENKDLSLIWDLTSKLHLSSDDFQAFFADCCTGKVAKVRLAYDSLLLQLKSSIFKDNISIGRGRERHIRFADPRVSNFEACLFAIDNKLFLSTGVTCSLKLNALLLESNTVYLIDEKATLSVYEQDFDTEILWSIYKNSALDDEIVFIKSDYDFLINRKNHRYSILLRRGEIKLNNQKIALNKITDVNYDDILQITGYAQFRLQNVIRDRALIGVDNLVPSELYITIHQNFYSLARTEADNSIAKIELSNGHYIINPPKRGKTIFLNQEKLTSPKIVRINSDTITINKRSFKINEFYDLIEIPFEVDIFDVQDLKHYFTDDIIALDSVSFSIHKGEILGIMGQSGCGKSTLMKTLGGELIPSYGDVKIDQKSLYSNLNYFSQYYGFVPQDDLLYPNLDVFENLWFRGRLNMPMIASEHLRQKIDNILHQVSLTHKAKTKVGDYKTKNLSGGERKRLNIALELLFEPTILILDEPTSGLSFTDAEQIIDILKSLASQGKIVITTIHQPNSSIFRKFDKVLLMDMGGKQVFFGKPDECYSYFDPELELLTHRKAEIIAKRDAGTSDFMYDVITYPEYGHSSSVVYEQVNKVIQVKRKFPPDYWRDKYRRKTLFDIIREDRNDAQQALQSVRKQRKKQDLRSYAIQIYTYTVRNFLMKMRNRENNIITFIEAPLLGLIISFILRTTPDYGKYTYAESHNIGIYIFVSIIAFIFMGMSNSIDEILSERKIIIRERQMNNRVSFYLLSKVIVLILFSFIQVLLYCTVSSTILQIKGVWGPTVLFLLLSSMIGFSIGLLVSSFIRDNKSIVNILPLIIIPQIIFGGAVIEFERMNRKLILTKRSPIPEVVHLIPSRWLFEGMTTSYAKNTIFHRKMISLEKKHLTLSSNDKKNVKTVRANNSLYIEKQKIVSKHDPNILFNRYLNASVGLLDGRFENEGKNVFLSSYKKVLRYTLRTWDLSLIIVLLYVLILNIISYIKLKLFYRE